MAAFVEYSVLLLLLLLALGCCAGHAAAPDLVSSAPRQWGAALATLAWLGGTAIVLRQARPADGGSGETALLPVVYASQTGMAESIARRTAEQLSAAGVAAEAVPMGQAWPLLGNASRLLFVASTTGEGDAPDDAFGFFRAMGQETPALSGTRIGVLALGDSCYSDFCGFGRQLDDWLRARGASSLFPRIEVDDGDPVALAAWFAAVEQHLADGRALADAPRPFVPWHLLERRCLNPGSLGAPAWHLELVPAEGGLPDWQAGDIAEVHPGSDPPREYSIASLPGDGALHLLVREHRRPDGTPGLASHLLCHGIAPGDSVALRIRSNSAFHPPADARPLLLVGNGTGMAGLRALLKAREAAGRHRNWLLFGERQPGVDAFHADDIARWLHAGVLERVDHAWSRGATRAYVQDFLLESAGTVRAWIDQGASIHVCGSLKGMAAGVDAALRTILGDNRVATLLAEGRYRRDVY